jgi:hypothetical protein
MSQRKCACNCGADLAGRSERTLYANERCRQRAYRRRVKRAAAAAGLPASLSLENVETAKGTRDRNGDAHTARRPRQTRRREGVSVYLKTPAHLAALIAAAESHQQVAADDDLDAALEAALRAKSRHQRRKR